MRLHPKRIQWNVSSDEQKPHWSWNLHGVVLQNQVQHQYPFQKFLVSHMYALEISVNHFMNKVNSYLQTFMPKYRVPLFYFFSLNNHQGQWHTHARAHTHREGTTTQKLSREKGKKDNIRQYKSSSKIKPEQAGKK